MIESQDILSGEVNLSEILESPVVNREELLQMGERLRGICKDFVRKCEEKEDIAHIDFDVFYDSVKRAERLKKFIYSSNLFFHRKYQEEDPFILLRKGFDAYSVEKYARASNYFLKALRGLKFENTSFQMQAASMAVKALLNGGFVEEAKEVVIVLRQSYGDLERYPEFTDILQELTNR